MEMEMEMRERGATKIRSLRPQPFHRGTGGRSHAQPLEEGLNQDGGPPGRNHMGSLVV